MRMVNSLISGAASMLAPRDLSESLCGAARAFDEFCNAVEKRSLRAGLKVRGGNGIAPISGWSLPDAVWTAASRKRPRLRLYPLCDIAGRALEKSVIGLLQPGHAGPADLTMMARGDLLQSLLRSSLERLTPADRTRLFLSNYFFEMAIDYLRRPAEQAADDWAAAYHFSARGRVVSTRAEHRFRRMLEAQCRDAAKEFHPFLANAIEESQAAADGSIAEGLMEVFGAHSDTTSTPSQTLRKPFVNVVIGSRVPTDLGKSFSVSDDVLRLSFDGQRRNLTCTFSALEELAGRPLHSLTKDLLEIGAAIYMTDIHCKRAPNLKRRIGMIIPVRHPREWTRSAPILERVVADLGGDDFDIHFRKKREKGERIPSLAAENGKRCVGLFSGGLDSLAGVASLDDAVSTILVSHYANNKLSGIQERLADAVGEARDQAATLSAMRIRVSAKQRRNGPSALPPRPRSPMTEFLRSFLFLSLASAVALESGIDTIRVFENGPVALNPLLSEGTVATHTAHPHVLAGFRELVRSVFGADLRIENPFQYETKGEVAKRLNTPRLRALAKHSTSCWNWFRAPVDAQDQHVPRFKGTHDGSCLPCILRRASTDAAGLWNRDAKYVTDVFASSPKEIDRHTLIAIADLVRFCRNVTTLEGADLLAFAPDLSVHEEGTNAAAIIAMIRRHAAEVLDCFRTRSSRGLKRMLSPLLAQ